MQKKIGGGRREGRGPGGSGWAGGGGVNEEMKLL